MVSVNGASAIASEPRYISPSPWPTASGEPLRAPISRSSSPANRKASANAPRSRGSAGLHRLHRLLPLLHLVGDQMRDHLGVGLARELRAGLFQFVAQLAEILDDAVVHHRDPVGRVRMRVALGRLAVGRPAGVADADGAVERRLAQPVFQIAQLALGAAARQRAAFQRRHARGVIAAIFEALERVDQWPATGSWPRMPTIPHKCVYPLPHPAARCLCAGAGFRKIKNACPHVSN